MRKLADAVLLLFCRLNHQALGILDAQSLNMTGWLELLATTIRVMLFSQSMPARLIVQLSTLASCLGQVQNLSADIFQRLKESLAAAKAVGLQDKEPPHLEQIRDFVASFAQPAAWLQSRFSGVSAVIGQVSALEPVAQPSCC